MRVHLISDNADTLVGMRLAGIEGVVLHEKEAVLKELTSVKEDKTIGILIVTEKILNMAKAEFMNLKISTNCPLIVEIPDRHGFSREKDYITRYIKDSIGIKI
ncbi:MAG: V-type ATP synthase subunit F [Thermotaleaceae bacterium]